MSSIRSPSTSRLSAALAAAAVFGLCVAPAWSMGLGAPAGVVTIGQALDVSVHLRLDAEEVLTADCLTADVQVGDRRLPPSQLRLQVDKLGADAARLRVYSASGIDEPVVVIHVTAACGNPISRRYVLLTEAPVLQATPALSAAAVASLSVLPDAEAPPRPVPTPAPTTKPAAVTHATGASAAVVLTAATWRTVGLRRPSASNLDARVQRRPQAASNAHSRRPTASGPSAPARRLRPAAGASRLQLDAAVPQLAAGSAVEQALQAVAQAAAAARQSASAASAAADRMAALERTVAQLRSEAQASRGQVAQLQEQLAHPASPALVWLLGMAAAVLALLAGWMARRLSSARSVQERARPTPTPMPEGQPPSKAHQAELRPVTVAMPLVHLGIDTDGPAASRNRPAPAWPPPAPTDGWEPSHPPDDEPVPVSRTASSAPPAATPPAASRVAPALQPPERRPEPVTQITLPQLGPALHGEPTARDVSIDELLDLEQQAEFFVVLGQDAAAIELLVEHLRHTGGGSPLPYLKLLEIHRRRGDRSDYERTRARFNHRFNAYAPEWDADLMAGRALADYPGVLPRLTQVWPRALDSMAELEALMFRKEQGELFDLPAYREILFLYALSRDLLDRESVDTSNVDLLLPLSDGGEFSSTAPTPFLDLGRPSGHGPADFEDRPTAPVDFDLTLGADRPSSIFDLMDAAPSPLPPLVR